MAATSAPGMSGCCATTCSTPHAQPASRGRQPGRQSVRPLPLPPFPSAAVQEPRAPPVSTRQQHTSRGRGAHPERNPAHLPESVDVGHGLHHAAAAPAAAAASTPATLAATARRIAAARRRAVDQSKVQGAVHRWSRGHARGMRGAKSPPPPSRTPPPPHPLPSTDCTALHQLPCPALQQHRSTALLTWPGGPSAATIRRAPAPPAAAAAARPAATAACRGGSRLRGGVAFGGGEMRVGWWCAWW